MPSKLKKKKVSSRKPSSTRKTTPSTNPNLKYWVIGLVLAVVALAGIKSIFTPKSVDINEVRSGSKYSYGSTVPSVTLITKQGASYNYTYGFGAGYNGNDVNVKMEGIAVGNKFYGWGCKSEAPADFNPSRGVKYVTKNGKYYSYGSTVVENKIGNIPQYEIACEGQSMDRTEVSGNEVVSTSTPVSTTTTTGNSSCKQMYYYNKYDRNCKSVTSGSYDANQNGCNGTSGKCGDNLKKYVVTPSGMQVTTGVCYSTQAACIKANIRVNE